LTVLVKMKDGVVSIPVPIRRRYKMWEGSLMELVLLDNGILIKPMIAKENKNEMIDRYVPQSAKILENEIISVVSELSSPQKNELVIEARR